MIKIANTTKGENKVLLRLKLQYTYDKLRVDRSESSFGGRTALTRREIRNGNKLTERALQVTAW